MLQVGEVLQLTDAQSAKVNLCDSGAKAWSLLGTLLADSGCAAARCAGGMISTFSLLHHFPVRDFAGVCCAGRHTGRCLIESLVALRRSWICNGKARVRLRRVMCQGRCCEQGRGGALEGLQLPAPVGHTDRRPEAGQAAAARLPRAALLRAPARPAAVPVGGAAAPAGEMRTLQRLSSFSHIAPQAILPDSLLSSSSAFTQPISSLPPLSDQVFFSSLASSLHVHVLARPARPHVFSSSSSTPRLSPEATLCVQPLAAGVDCLLFLVLPPHVVLAHTASSVPQCKLAEERQPVDLWLLGLHGELVERWGPLHRHAQLNALERVLLAAAAGPTALSRCAADMAASCRQASRDRC